MISYVTPEEDSHSEQPFDALSDGEPPKDMPRERRLITKNETCKVFKEILKVGSGLDKPAKYDLVHYYCEETDD
jgi:hypothetical protein